MVGISQALNLSKQRTVQGASQILTSEWRPVLRRRILTSIGSKITRITSNCQRVKKSKGRFSLKTQKAKNGLRMRFRAQISPFRAKEG